MTKPVPSPAPARPTRRISDLERSAFWIYGVTAMVMREPLGLVVRHSSEAGLWHWQVRLELLRVAVALLLLSRLFLASGLYFDQVFMQPESADRYPRRSYPVDFLAGLMQFLVAAAATTVVGLHVRATGVFAPFLLIAWLFLSVDSIWLAITRLRAFSSAPLIARNAKFNGAVLLSSLLAWGVSRAAGLDAVFAEQAALGIVAVATAWDIWAEIRRFEAFDSPA